MKQLTIRYTLHFPGQPSAHFVVRVDAQTLDPLDALPDALPAWTRLEFHQCAHCPLTPATHRWCPVAARLVPLVDYCASMPSYAAVRVEVATPERTVLHDTTAQQAVSSLMGLLMAVSGCPHTAYFKPMARYHLPLASPEETVYRAAAMYQLAQYFIHRSRGSADLEMRGLRLLYTNLEQLNVQMAARLRAATTEDAAVNALVMLDVFAKQAHVELEAQLRQLAGVFRPYLKS